MNVAFNQVLLGADPEAFVRSGPFEIAHCIGVLGGSKDAPRLVRDGAVQEDNVLFEFNIDATDNCDVFVERINSVLEQGRDILRQTGLQLVPNVSSHVYDSMEGFPEKAFEFGCTPDYNGLTGEQNPRPSAENLFLRTAGGHVHIGWSHVAEVTKQDQGRVIVACDYLLGLHSLLEDDDTRRRELYGKGGACRYKPYGVEYRTLSNYWIWDRKITKSVAQRAKLACIVGTNQLLYDQLTAIVTPEVVQQVINDGDVAMARIYSNQVTHMVARNASF